MGMPVVGLHRASPSASLDKMILNFDIEMDYTANQNNCQEEKV